MEKLEVIVIDNGSSDNTVAIAVEKGATVYIRPELTISGMRNFGAGCARGEVLAFVDADVQVKRDWLQCALPILYEEGVGCVGCSPEIPDSASWVERVWHTQIVVRPERYEKDWIASMNMLVMKRAFEATGGFNEKLRTCEDVDFCYRLNKRWKIVYSKNIRAVHYGGAQSLVHLFKKESWRGISNFEGIKSHGFSLQELPSHAVALYYCCALLALPLLLILDHNSFFIVAFTSLLPPGLKSINIVKRARVYSHVLPLMTLLTVYCFARGWSVIRFFLKMYHR